MKDIKPIETEYNGYRFRSRIEARWAVFFDAAGIPYEYEPEGYVIDDRGTGYLPDFYLPWFNAFVEIKPKTMTDEVLQEAKRKCEMLFQHDNCVVMLCCGDPVECQMLIYCNEIEASKEKSQWNSAEFIEGGWYLDRVEDGADGSTHGYSKHYLTIAVGGIKDNTTRNYVSSTGQNCCLEQRARLVSVRSMLEVEKQKGRQARFESAFQ